MIHNLMKIMKRIIGWNALWVLCLWHNFFFFLASVIGFSFMLLFLKIFVYFLLDYDLPMYNTQCSSRQVPPSVPVTQSSPRPPTCPSTTPCSFPSVRSWDLTHWIDCRHAKWPSNCYTTCSAWLTCLYPFSASCSDVNMNMFLYLIRGLLLWGRVYRRCF